MAYDLLLVIKLVSIFNIAQFGFYYNDRNNRKKNQIQEQQDGKADQVSFRQIKTLRKNRRLDYDETERLR